VAHSSRFWLEWGSLTAGQNVPVVLRRGVQEWNEAMK